MALHNPNNLYTAGAVVAPQPSLNLYAQVLQRQQAKADAMDQYERSRINSVNDAGVRDIDRKTLDDKLGELRGYYQGNKPVIQKGNSKEAFEYEKKFRDLKDFVAQSKDRSARHNAALQFYNERLKQDQRLPDDFMLDLHSNDMPLGSKKLNEQGEYEEYQPFDISKWASEPKPFTQQSYLTSFKDIKRTPGQPVIEPIKDNPLKLNETITEAFDKDAKQVIAARAADKYDNSYSFSNQVKNEIADPARRKQLSDLFQQEYGTPPALPSDYAVAYTMEMLQPKTSKSKVIDNKEAISAMNDRLARGRIAVRDFYERGRIDYRHQKDVEDALASDEKFDNLWDKTKDNLPANLVTKVFGSPVDPKGHKIPPPEVVLSPDKKTYDFNVYVNGEKSDTYSKTLSADVVKAQLKQDLTQAVKTKTQAPVSIKGNHKIVKIQGL